MDMRKDRRFVVIERERSYLSDQGLQIILADRKTGVSYLYVKSGYGAGITPLIGPDGKPMIRKPWGM